MDNSKNITESEWVIMNLLWDNNPQTSEQLISALSKKMNWAPQTIKTFINRLLKKNIIQHEKKGRGYLYYPVLTREECQSAENKSFLSKVYNGTLKSLLCNFIENDDKLSESDIAEIQELLNKKKLKDS